MPAKKTTVKKKNPTTVSNSYTSGKTVKFVDPKTGITHITNDAGGKTTYHKYNKDGTFAGGYTQNAFGVFGAADGGRKIPISADAYNKKPKVEEIKKEIIKPPVKKEIVKPATGQTVAELWKEKTGTSWSEAKKQGLTDGSAKNNLALMAKLKSGEYKPKAKEEVKVEPKVESKISSYIKPDEVGPYYSKDEVVDPNKGKMGPMDDPNKPKLKRGGSIKSKITAVKSKIKSKIMSIKKPLLKAKDGISTPQDKKSSSGQVTQYNKAITPGGSTGDAVKSGVGNFKRGGSIKMKAGGTMKMKTGGMVNSNKKVLVKATYGTAMKPMMKMGGSTLKKAMYGTMMKPKMIMKGSTKKK